MNLEEKALKFATEAHQGQTRKYTGEPYINHPIAVAELVKSVPGHTPEMVAAALLHDTVEDTQTTIRDISREFGYEVAILVSSLTDVSKPTDGNRAVRKQKDLEHIAKACPMAKTIKIADLIDNTKTIRELDPDFWKIYKQEKIRLLRELVDGDETLWHIANIQANK